MTVEARSIVVGVDSSPSAQGALAWALDEARLRRAPLTVVHAWREPTVYGAGLVDPIGVEDLRAGGEAVLRDAVEPSQRKYPDVTISTHLSDDSAPLALIEASREAELLVVGSRGRGGFVGLLLGSVSRAAVHHAHCPVVVVREGSR